MTRSRRRGSSRAGLVDEYACGCPCRSEQVERHQPADLAESLAQQRLLAVEHRRTFGPAGGDVGDHLRLGDGVVADATVGPPVGAASGGPGHRMRIAYFRWKPVTASNSSRIRLFSAGVPTTYVVPARRPAPSSLPYYFHNPNASPRLWRFVERFK